MSIVASRLRRLIGKDSPAARYCGYYVTKTPRYSVNSWRSFQTIGNSHNFSTPESEARLSYSMKLKEKLANLEEFASAGGGDKAIKRHVEKNKKLLVRERICKLLNV